MGKLKVIQAGVSFDRPDDYFAEMIKSDQHMFKVNSTFPSPFFLVPFFYFRYLTNLLIILISGEAKALGGDPADQALRGCRQIQDDEEVLQAGPGPEAAG